MKIIVVAFQKSVIAKPVRTLAAAIRSPKAPLRKGKSPKRCQWQKKRGGFEEVPRLAATIVAGNRLARRWAGCHGEAVTEGSTHRTPCYANASGGALSVTSDRKCPKNAAKTNGFGFLARARCRTYRDPSTPRITRRKPVSCFRIASGSIHRDALRACAALV